MFIEDQIVSDAMSDFPGFMLDTNIFNNLLDERFALTSLGECRLLVTGIQRDELGSTPNEIRRAALLQLFDTINPAVVITSSFAFGIEGAGWDQASWNDDIGMVARLRARLQELDGRKLRRKHVLNQERDVLIAETTIKTGAVLVSSDSSLCRLVEELGGKALNAGLLAGVPSPMAMLSLEGVAPSRLK